MSRAAGGPDALELLERQPLRPYYLLYGEETFLLDRALDLLRRRLLPPGQPGTWRSVWADDQGERLAGALTDLESPSLFGGMQVLVVRRADALRDEEQERVGAVLSRLGAGGALILVARAADQRRRLFVSCVRAGAAVACTPLADGRLGQSWVVQLARERGHAIAPAAGQELLDRTGLDLGVVAGEIEKLGLHAGPGTRIETEHVRAMVGSVRAHAVQELTERLGRGDVAGTVSTLRRLLAEGEPPLRLLGFLAANLRRALHVAELAESGLGPDDIAARLGMPPWLVSRVRGRGRAQDMVRALWVLRRLDQDLKSTRPSDAVFEAALVAIAGAGADRRPGRNVNSPAAG